MQSFAAQNGFLPASEQSHFSSAAGINATNIAVNVRNPNVRNQDIAKIETFAGSDFGTFGFQTFRP